MVGNKTKLHQLIPFERQKLLSPLLLAESKKEPGPQFSSARASKPLSQLAPSRAKYKLPHQRTE
jgi:hypothetical protein